MNPEIQELLEAISEVVKLHPQGRVIVRLEEAGKVIKEREYRKVIFRAAKNLDFLRKPEATVLREVGNQWSPK